MNLHKAYPAMEAAGATKQGKAMLSAAFKTCHVSAQQLFLPLPFAAFPRCSLLDFLCLSFADEVFSLPFVG